MDPFELGDMVFAEQDSSLPEVQKQQSDKGRSTVLRKFSKLQVHQNYRPDSQRTKTVKSTGSTANLGDKNLKLQGELNAFQNPRNLEDLSLLQERTAYFSDGVDKRKSPKRFRDPRAFMRLSERQMKNSEELGQYRENFDELITNQFQDDHEQQESSSEISGQSEIDKLSIYTGFFEEESTVPVNPKKSSLQKKKKNKRFLKGSRNKIHTARRRLLSLIKNKRRQSRKICRIKIRNQVP